MGRASFDSLWIDYQKNKVHGIILLPDADRCALVLSLTLGLHPRQDTDKASFQDLSVADIKPERREGDGNYYVRAAQLAERLKVEWGPPRLTGPGALIFSHIPHSRGVLFVQRSFRYAEFRHHHPTLGEHIDLWNGSIMASQPDPAKCKQVVEFALKVEFWDVV
jgi:hypothetical protein